MKAMPQREHFEIYRLLEVKAGLVVITKIDRSMPRIYRAGQRMWRVLRRIISMERRY
jgi:selenocysteine-specific translation elongation factor